MEGCALCVVCWIVTVGDRKGEHLVSLAYPLLFGLFALSAMSTFLLIVSIGILLSRIPAI